MTTTYLLAIDQGTTGSTAQVIRLGEDQTLKVIGQANAPFPLSYPHPNWVEQDLEEIWTSVETSVIKAFQMASHQDSQFAPESLGALGITNQRETLCVFDPKTSKPLRKAIVWQCKRSTDICKTLHKEGLGSSIQEKTGLVIDPYFTGSKVRWLMEEEPSTAKLFKEGKALLGTIDTWLIHRLTGAQTFVTEPSNASRTLLFNTRENKWDQDLCEIMKLPSRSCLPDVLDSAGLMGKTKGVHFLPDGLPITGVLGDQQAALAGQGATQVGEGKCTYGTGAFLLVNQGKHFKISKNGLLTTIAWSLKGKPTYAFEGSSFIAGAAVQFIRDQLHLITKAQDTDLTSKVEASPYLYFVPSLVGLGAPYWNPNAKGSFLGLSRSTTKEQMIQATLEGIAFQVTDLIHVMRQELGSPITTLRVDGGASENKRLLQCQAHLSELTIKRPEITETTALGAALMAALGGEFISSLEDLRTLNPTVYETTYPQSFEDTQKRKRQVEGWLKSVQATQMFAEFSASAVQNET